LGTSNWKRLGRPQARVPIERLQRVSGLPAHIAAERLGVSRSTIKRWRRGVARQLEHRPSPEG
jgi:transposase